MELSRSSRSDIKKNSYIFSKESISYISRNGTLHFLGQAQIIKRSTSIKFLILEETETPKNLLIFPQKKAALMLLEKGSQIFFYFRKQETKKKILLLKCFLYFRKLNILTLSLKNFCLFRRTT